MGLIGELHRLQEEHGHLRDADLRTLSERLNVPLYRLQGLASFYPHFRTSPPPEVEVTVCRDMSCHLAGAEALYRCLRTELAAGIDDGRVEVHQVSCLGRCDAAPAACLSDLPVPMDAPAEPAARARQIAAWVETPEEHPVPGPPVRSWRVDPYEDKAARYGVVSGLLDEAPLEKGSRLSPTLADRVLRALEDAGLRGMGGAGFPTHTKWKMVREHTAEQKVVIINADESEPGTFKDRVILEELPHLVIEGAILAGLVAGAARGIVYIRHEYGRERVALEAEIERARGRGLLRAARQPTEGDSDTGSTATSDHGGVRVPFDLEIFVSPGGYILGEETALLEALEDRRGEPRNKPPFPVHHGLHGRPTIINNVETLAMVPAILSRGAGWWKDQGRGDFTGLKFISVSGDVKQPGVYEIDTGTPIGELIETAGGVSGGKPIAVLAPGGASSPFLPPDRVNVPLDFGALQDAGSMLGSGALMVAAEGADLLALATNVVAFFRNESCGKCVPCRTGSEKAVNILEDVLAGRGDAVSVELLPQLGETLLLTSICGLGQVALTPVLSIMKHFPDLLPQRLSASGNS